MSQPESEGRLLGPYRLTRRLASGGLSAVFLASDTRDESQVAVKVFKPEVEHDPELVWLAERSLAVTRQLAHPNLIRITDGGVHDGRRYSVMEYVEGGRTLARELASGPLGLQRGLQVLRQVLEAIETIHAAGMAHRDLKPDNVLLLAEGEQVRAKVLDLDFLGPIGHRRLARVREILGTPKYMAPEEIHRGYPHPRGDLFSIGVMAFELFSGTEPFPVEKEVGYLYANRFGAAPGLRTLRPDLPEPVERFVAGLLARQPGERYDARTALQDCRALERACDGGSVALVGPPRIRRWPSQQVWLRAGLLLLPAAVALVLFVSGGTPAALPWADALLPLPLPPDAPLARPPAPPAWPRWVPRGAAPPAPEREWEQARLAGRSGLPADRRAALERLGRIAAGEQHPFRDRACALLARLHEADYQRLRQSDPPRALASLRAACAAALDADRRLRLSQELTRFEQQSQQRALAERAPPGFVLCPGEARVFLSRDPVSNLAYLAYVQQRGAAAPPDWTGGGPRPGTAHLAVRGVGAEAAAGYAGWRGARLPRQSELDALRGKLAGDPPEWAIDGQGRVASPGGAATFRLALPAGRKLGAAPEATPRHVLQLDSTPAGAEVWHGKTLLGRTPLELPLHQGGLLDLELRRAGSLPAPLHVELDQPRLQQKVPLYDATVLPGPLRDYPSSRESAYRLLALAASKPARLARNFHLLLLQAHPRDWKILATLRERLADPRRPLLLARIDRTLADLDRQIDALRAARYNGKRTTIDRALDRLGFDPHWRMAHVPDGAFKSGAEHPRKNEFPLRERTTRAFWVDCYEVTNREYARFVSATGHAAPAHFAGGKPPAALLDHPVTGVSLLDARAYARWAGKRLPTEWEWEKAARGKLYRRYPWGKEFWHQAANTLVSRIGTTTPVGRYAAGRSVFELHDMAGNVWELTESLWTERHISRHNAIKGGSFRSGRDECRVAARQPLDPARGAGDVGFRCVSDP